MKVGLAESALHAPAAGFGETEFYPDFVDEPSVLAVRLTKNHPLPDGNKRAAWVALRPFLIEPDKPGLRARLIAVREPEDDGLLPVVLDHEAPLVEGGDRRNNPFRKICDHLSREVKGLLLARDCHCRNSP